MNAHPALAKMEAPVRTSLRATRATASPAMQDSIAKQVSTVTWESLILYLILE